jgi:hypothetical protein
LRGVFLAYRHQPRHFGLGNGDLAPPPVGQRQIGDDIIAGFLVVLLLRRMQHREALSKTVKKEARREKVSPALSEKKKAASAVDTIRAWLCRQTCQRKVAALLGSPHYTIGFAERERSE